VLAGSDAQARSLAVTGAVTQMVSHGLVTGALFLLSGVLYDRGGTYDMGAYGGLAARTPRFAALTAVAAFASLGLPGLSGFIAEFQIFTGSLASVPVAVCLALPGVLLTAALLLLALHRVFLGAPRDGGGTGAGGERGVLADVTDVADVTAVEASAVVPLLVLVVVIGVFPRWLLDVIEPASHAVAVLVAR